MREMFLRLCGTKRDLRLLVMFFVSAMWPMRSTISFERLLCLQLTIGIREAHRNFFRPLEMGCNFDEHTIKLWKLRTEMHLIRAHDLIRSPPCNQDAIFRRIVESRIIDPLKDFHRDFRAALNMYDRIKHAYYCMQLFIAGAPMADINIRPVVYFGSWETGIGHVRNEFGKMSSPYTDQGLRQAIRKVWNLRRLLRSMFGHQPPESPQPVMVQGKVRRRCHSSPL